MAYRQKPTHTHPSHITKVKNKLQQRLKSSKHLPPNILSASQNKHRKSSQAELGLANLRQRRRRQKLQRAIPISLIALITLISVGLFIWTSSTPFISLFTSLLICCSFAALVSAIRQFMTLNL